MLRVSQFASLLDPTVLHDVMRKIWTISFCLFPRAACLMPAFDRLERLERFERLRRTRPRAVNVAERLNGWNDWNVWNEPLSMEVK
jgi:hypothetical protein